MNISSKKFALVCFFYILLNSCPKLLWFLLFSNSPLNAIFPIIVTTSSPLLTKQKTKNAFFNHPKYLPLRMSIETRSRIATYDSKRSILRRDVNPVLLLSCLVFGVHENIMFSYGKIIISNIIIIFQGNKKRENLCLACPRPWLWCGLCGRQ